MQCLVCDHEQVLRLEESIFKSKCERCCSKFMQVAEVQPTKVRGAGRNAVADLGLALLMEAGAGADIDDE